MLPNLFRPESQYEDRKRQINTLKIFNDNVTEIQEDVQYQVEFKCGGNPMRLVVQLGQNFPMERPTLIVIPPLEHPWIDTSGQIISFPGLLQFTIHSDLGRVVQAIIRELERNPVPAKTLTNHHVFTNVEIKETTESGDIDLMEYLKDLSIEDLQKLNESEECRDDFLKKNIPSIFEEKKKILEILDKILDLSKNNLAKRPLLEVARSSKDEKNARLSEHRNTFEILNQQYQNIAKRYSPESICEALRVATSASDEASEEIANQFLEREIDLEQFLHLYLAERTKSHSRKTKEEKLSNQIQELHKAGY